MGQKNVASITHYFISDMECPKKKKTKHERSCQSFSSILKTDCLHLKTGYKDEEDCLWKQLKWNKFPFCGDRLSAKIIHGINIADSVSEKIV